MNVIYRQLKYTLPLSIIIFIGLQLVWFINGVDVIWNTGMLISFCYVLLYTVGLQAANTYMFITIGRLYNKKISFTRLLVSFLASVLVSVGLIFIFRIVEDVIIESRPLAGFLNNEVLSNYYFATGVTIILSLIIHIAYYYKNYQENRIKQQQIIAGNASAKFETLKNQIDPHFLFNSLNVLSSLIEENPENAQRFTTALSKVYRYVLEQKDKELVTVEEEIAFARTYMNLLKMRFENSIFYELPQQVSNPEARVVPLSLQLLLENTVKHNIVSQQKPLHIRIYEGGNMLVVQNDYQKKEVLQQGRGVGLQNIISRYAIITNRKVEIIQTQEHFTVKLPILTKQITIMETVHFEQDNSYYRAQKKVEKIRGFYGNLASYISIIFVLMILNLATSPEYLWFLWPAMGWGIGVALHGMSVFNYMPFIGSDWEERKIKEFMEKEKNSK